jgi:polysaccharide biosynthesis protein PelG
MAGIGFALRKHLRKDTYLGFLTAYLLAGVIGSGPWVISIGSMLLIGTLSPIFAHVGASEGPADGPAAVSVFLATVTQLMATSLVVSGLLQHLFTRFVADRSFEKRDDLVVPNLFGALFFMTAVSGGLAALVAIFGFTGHFAYRVLLVMAFVTLCNLWVLTVVLSGMKGYRSIVLVFACGYALTVAAALLLAPFGTAGYLAGFCIGQASMLFAMLLLVVREYPSEQFVAFEFLERKRVHPELALAGFAFNLGVWADKFVFWLNPITA